MFTLKLQPVRNCHGKKLTIMFRAAQTTGTLRYATQGLRRVWHGCYAAPMSSAAKSAKPAWPCPQCKQQIHAGSWTPVCTCGMPLEPPASVSPFQMFNVCVPLAITCSIVHLASFHTHTLTHAHPLRTYQAREGRCGPEACPVRVSSCGSSCAPRPVANCGPYPHRCCRSYCSCDQ